MLGEWKLKDVLTIVTMAGGLVVWGARLEAKLNSHQALPHHASVPGLVDRRVDEKIKIARSEDMANMATLLAEMRHLKDEVIRMREEIGKIRSGMQSGKRRTH